jgi:hypothetical protein
MDALIAALNAIGTPDCVNSARRLEALKPDAASFDLHLRRATETYTVRQLQSGAVRPRPATIRDLGRAPQTVT